MKEIESPTGIDLNPDPPPVVRLSKRAGAIVLSVVAVVLALIGYGVLTRNHRSLQIGDIPAVLEQALNSDLPGEVKALVRENVFDTATGRHLLIPQGARLVGIYDSRVAYGRTGF